MLKFEKPGYVYVLTNETMPGLIKIGYTQNDPQYRADELYTTGLPRPWVVYDYMFAEDAEAIEEACHVELYKKRSNMDREFFSCHPEEAVFVIRSQMKEYRKKLFSNYKTKNNKVVKYLTKEYDNPKFEELLALLIKNKGKESLSLQQISKDLNMTEKGVSSIFYVMEKLPIKILYIQKNKVTGDIEGKYNLYLKFGQNQLNELKKIYPKIDFTNSQNQLNKINTEKQKQLVKNYVLDKENSLIYFKAISYLKIAKELFDNNKLQNKNEKVKIYFTLEELSKEIDIEKEKLENVVKICENDRLLKNSFYSPDNKSICFDFNFYKNQDNIVVQEPYLRELLMNRKIKKNRKIKP